MTTSPTSKHSKWLGVQRKDQHALKYSRPLSIQGAKVKEALITCRQSQRKEAMARTVRSEGSPWISPSVRQNFFM